MVSVIKQKKEIISSYAVKSGDTGSPEVQVALITTRVAELADHLKTHVKDNHSRRGLLGVVATRQKTLKYIAKKDPKRHAAVVKKLEEQVEQEVLYH